VQSTLRSFARIAEQIAPPWAEIWEKPKGNQMGLKTEAQMRIEEIKIKGWVLWEKNTMTNVATGEG